MGGRKNLKRAVEDVSFSLQPGQSVMQVVSLRGSNLIEVMDAKCEKSLALFPAKFQKSMWIKRGNFVVVDGSGREHAVESGSKVTCIVSQVLFHEQIRRLQKSPEWPEAFKSQANDNKDIPEPSTEQDVVVAALVVEEEGSSDDDDLPPLEANTNRRRPFGLRPSFSELDSDSDSNS